MEQDMELYSQVQLSKLTGISRSTIRDYIRDYSEFLDPQTGYKNGFKAYNNIAMEIIVHIKEMHDRGLTINVIKELLAEKYPMQINDTVSREPQKSKVVLRDKIPPGLVSKQEYGELAARVVELSNMVVGLTNSLAELEKKASRVDLLEEENKELKQEIEEIKSVSSENKTFIAEVNEKVTITASTVDKAKDNLSEKIEELYDKINKDKKTFEEFMEEYRASQQKNENKPWWKKLFNK